MGWITLARLSPVGLIALVGAGGCRPARETGGAMVRVAVTVDWEGAYITDEGLSAMAALRARLPNVPLTHFVTPAYYTKPSADAAAVTARLRQAIRADDQVCLHLHMWASLATAAGVEPERGPSFLLQDHEPLDFAGDAGWEVDVSGYSRDELRAIVARARSLLEEAGFGAPDCFRAAAWLARKDLLEAISAEGIRVDASAIDASWLDEPGTEFLREKIAAVWPNVDRSTAPFWIRTSAGDILELPDTGALSDYATTAETVDHIERALERAKRDRSADVFVQVGFHHETAEEYAGILADALERFTHLGDRVVFERLETSAVKAAQQLRRASGSR